MADDADRAQERDEILQQHRPRMPDGPSFTGSCHFCGEEVRQPRRWCDNDCRTDWERGQRVRRTL